MFLLCEWAPDNGVVIVTVYNLIRTVPFSVESLRFLRCRLPFSKELSYDALLVLISILDSLECNVSCQNAK